MSRQKWMIAVIVSTVLTIVLFAITHANSSGEFVEYPLPLKETSRLFDIGVVDANGDKLLDIYTSNHHFRQSLLINDGRGGYKDVLSEWGLDQSRDFPLAELTFLAPVMERAGVYIYWYGTALVIETRKLAELGPLQGRLSVNDPVEIVNSGGFGVRKQDQATPVSETAVEFSTNGDAKLVLRPGGQGLPVNFQINEQIPLTNLFVGLGRISPKAHKFSLAMQDRHALAWADYNNDGVLDIFIPRGALSGMLRAYPEDISRLINDELFISQAPGKFIDRSTELGVDKRDCSGRHARWLDFNQDGLLDLYVNCHDREHYQGDYPKQLYLQGSSGYLTDAASEVGLGMPDRQIRSFAWIDVDGDGDIDLITVEDEGLFLYRTQEGGSSQELLRALATAENGKVGQSESPKWYYDGKLIVSDYDADGDLDLFSASIRGNTLLSNDNGKLVPIEPRSIGLPASSTTASWVDYDNDGLTDLYTVPHGLFRQKSHLKFEATNLLTFPDGQYQAAISNWFDIDNDGHLDLMLALNKNPDYQRWWELFAEKTRPSTWLVKTYRNKGINNHWLQIELKGIKGNQQGIGAQVTVATTDGGQVQEVGATDGAFFSQGHYRLYFGLGNHEKADSVTIHWSDGYQQEITEVSGDRLLVIQRDKTNGENE